MRDPIIRAHIRQWRQNKNAIEGKCYGDTRQIYFDGEDIILLSIENVREGSDFFLFDCENSVYRADKSEEIV